MDVDQTLEDLLEDLEDGEFDDDQVQEKYDGSVSSPPPPVTQISQKKQTEGSQSGRSGPSPSSAAKTSKKKGPKKKGSQKEKRKQSGSTIRAEGRGRVSRFIDNERNTGWQEFRAPYPESSYTDVADWEGMRKGESSGLRTYILDPFVYGNNWKTSQELQNRSSLSTTPRREQ